MFPSWRPITKRTLDLFGRWGDPRTQLRGMMDMVLPVAVVDRFRDDDEGSIFGLNAFTTGPVGEFPSISFGSNVNDWELLQIASISMDYNSGAGTLIQAIHMFTPIAPYNPATTIVPLGFFTPGMINNRAFTLGSVQAIGGTTPLPPVVLGPEVVPRAQQVSFPAISPITNDFLSYQPFNPPIRIYRDVTLTIQYVGSLPGGVPAEMTVSIIYRERPKVSTQ